MHKNFNKKAQVGETVTWVFATVIIIVVLGISIFVASAKFNTDKKPDLQSVSKVDTLASKSLFSYILTKNFTGQTVYEQLADIGNLSNDNGNLAEKIFNGFFRKDYSTIWVGTTDEYGFGLENVFFGKMPNSNIEGKTTSITIPGAFDSIFFKNSDNSTDIVLLSPK